MSRSPRHRRPLIEALEPRLLFSATADIAVFDDGSSDGQYLADAADQVDLVSIYMPPELLAVASSEPPVTTLIFVDPLVEDYELLVNDILQNHPTDNIQIIYLDAGTDGIAQITESLAGFSQIDSLHIISHGAPGAIALGNTLLSNDNISSHETELTAWRNALSDDADILLYGCNVAAGAVGQQLVTRVASLTGADIAASENTTGHASLQGDWQLEFAVGEIEHSVLVSAAAQESWVNTFATTQYINIQGGSSNQAVSSATNVGQSFLVDNGGAPYTINQISVQLMRTAGAANQDITIHLLDGGWGDASPLASRVISFDKLTTDLAWKTINFSDVVLNSGQTYIIRITSSNADGNVSVAYSNTNRWNNSEMIVSGVSNASADLNLLVGYNNGINQASVNTVPGPQSTGQNTSLVFSAANGNQIQIADADAFPNAMEVTLAGNIGFFSLAQTTGLTFIGGDGTADYYMRFQGSISAINAALATITYTPSTNVTGDDTFSISTKDLGLNSVETVSNVTISVNHPLNIVPGAQSVNEDTSLQFSQANGNRIQITDPGLGMDTSNVKVTLSVSNGLLTLASMAGVTFTSGDGTSDALLVFNGSLANINAALATITFAPTANYNGSTSLTIVTEGSSSGGPVKDSDSINITVNSVNDAPTVANPIPNRTMTEGSALNYVMPANTFNDVDGGSLSYVATLSGGQALPVWLQFNSVTRTFSGVPDDGDVGTLSIRVTATDTGGLSVFDDFDLTINNLPEAPFVVNPIPDQVASGFTPFSYQFPAFNDASPVFADPDVGGSVVSYRATLADGSSLPGWLNFDSATRTFSGTPTNGDAGTITIKLYGTDNTGLESVTPDQFNIVTSATVNDAPVNTVPGAQSTNEDTALVFNLANGNRIQIADADALSASVQVTLSVSNGLLTLAGTAGLSFTTGDGTSDATLVFTGTVANINTALATLTYTPTGNYSGADTLNIVTNDLGNSGTGGAKSDSDSVAITVNAVNDAPVNTVPGAQTGTEDTALVFSAGNGNQIQINDIDAGSSSMQVTLSVTNGTLTLAGVAGLTFTTGDGTADSSLVFTGTRAAINTALATLTFNPTANYNGAAVLSLTTSDLGNTGSGGTKTDADTVNITINAANDAPTILNPINNQNATEDAPYTYTFANNVFSDIDGNTLSYSAQITGGGAWPSWLSFNSTSRTFSGTPLNANVGTISIDVTASDGFGGAVTDTFTLTVANTNDAPTVAIPIPNKTTAQDAPFSFQIDPGTFTDQDIGSSLTYSAELASGGALTSTWLSFDAATHTFSGTPANGNVGTISVRVIANDGFGGIVSDVFDITVTNINDAPVIVTPIADQAATQGILFNFSFGVNAFSDPDLGTTLTYTAQLGGGLPWPAWLSFDDATRTFSGTPTNGDVGTISVEVTASDGTASVTDTFNIVVGNTPDAPYLAISIPNQSATEGVAFNFPLAAGTFVDPDGDPLDYSATMADGSPLTWLVFNPATQTFAGTPGNADVGTISIRVTADDGTVSPVATGVFDIVITNTNDAPTVLNPIDDQNATEDSAFNFTFAADTFTDVDVGDGLTYSAQLAGGGALPAWLFFDAGTRTFNGTPLNAHVGTVSIDVIASDGNGGSVTDTFSIVVANTNDAPIVDNAIAGQNATQGVAFNFQIPGNTFLDVDGDTLTYSASLSGGGALPLWLEFDDLSGTFSGTPANGDVGSLTIDVTVNDGKGGTVTDTFGLVIANTNDAPTVIITATDYNAIEQELIDLHGTGITVADVDGDALTITITGAGSNSNLAATVGTTGVVIVSGMNTNTLILSGTAAQLNDLFAGNNSSTLTYRLSGDTPAATRLLTISASDGSLSGNDTAIINITAVNDGPANSVPGAQTTDEDTALVFSSGNGNQIQIDDLDAGTSDLEVTLSVTNGTLTLAGVAGLAFTTGDGTADSSLVFRGTQTAINTALATLTFNPTTNFNGAAQLTITTSDLGNTGTGGTLTDSDNINITINAVNDAPTVANAIPNQNATEDVAFTFQFAVGAFADVDLNILTYTVQLAGGGLLPTWLIFDAATRTFSGTPANGDVGTVSIDVIANDGNGGTITDTFDIVVANTNDAPTLDHVIPDRSAADGVPFTFQFAANTFSDIDVSDTLTYSATLNGGGALPLWLSFDSATRTFSGVPATSDVGVLTIDVTANDGNGGTVTDTFTLTVTDLPDTEYIDTGNGGAQIPVSSANQVGQSFSYNSAGATYTVNEISLYLARYDAAAAQTITVELRDAWNGAILASDSIPSSQISRDGFGWHSFSFANVALNDSQTYVIQISSTGTDDLILVSRNAGNTFADGAMIENGVLDATGWDLAFKIAKDDGANAAPVVVNPIADQTLDAELPFNLVVPANTFSDPDANDTMTYRAQLAGGGSLGWLTFNEASRTFSGTPHWHQAGTMTVELIATDNHGASTSEFFDIDVINTNIAPTVANPIPDQVTDEDAPFSFQFDANAFADVDVGNTFIYSAELAVVGGLPPWLSFDAATRTFSGTPTNEDVGTWTIEVTANDGFGGEVIDTFVITVANTNDAPTLANPIADQNAIENSAFSFQFAVNTFNDQDVGDVFAYSAQLAGGGALPTWLSFDSATRTFSGTPANANIGSISIDVIANDGNGGIITDTFALVISNQPINAAPTLQNAIADQIANEDSPFGFTVPANTFADAEGDTLNYSSQLSGGGALPAWLRFDAVTRTFSGTPTNDDIGNISVLVSVSDGNGGTASDVFVITVNNTNDAPVLVNPPANQTTQENSPFAVSFGSNMFADVDANTTLVYNAQLTNGDVLPAWLVFDAATLSFSGTPTNGDTGNLSIQIIASDGIANASAQFQLTVIPVNDSPVTSGFAPINNLEDAAGDTVDLFAAFSDAESAANQLQYSVVSNSNPTLVSGATIDAATGKLQLTYGANQFGSADLIIRAQDAQGAMVETSLRVNIESVNDTPTTTGIVDLRVQAGAAAQQMNLHNVFSDIEDTAQLKYSLLGNTNPAVATNIQIDPATGMMTLVFSSSTGGESTITLRALDTDGAWVDTQFKVTVTAVVVPPVVVPPIVPPVVPPIAPPVTPEEPGTLPPTIPPITEIPITNPPVGGGSQVIDPLLPVNPDDTIDTNVPGIGGSSNVITGDDDHAEFAYVNDQSSRDYARAAEMLNSGNVPLTTLTASTALTSLITPDAGFAPWEAEEFDSEVRRIRAQMDDALEEEHDRKAVVAGLTFSVTTGLLIWSLRASSLLLTMMSMLPLWRGLDPLPILDEVNKKKKELEQQRKDREREDKSAKEVGYLFDHAQSKDSRS